MIAVDEALALHENLAVDHAVIAAAIAVLAAAWLTTARALACEGRTRWAFSLAASLWALGAVLAGVVTDGPGAIRITGELLEIASGPVLLAALLTELQATRAARISNLEPRPAARALAEQLVLAVKLRTLVVAVVSLMALFGVLGALVIGGADWRPVDLGEERTIPAYFSTLLLWTGAGLALLVAALRGRARRERLLWYSCAAILALMGVSEVAKVHERFQYEAGAPALISMSPAVVFAAAIGVLLVRAIWRDAGAREAMAGGLLAWGLALHFDEAHYPDGTKLDYLIVLEELLEMTGSALIALSLFVLARRTLKATSSAGRRSARSDTTSA